eukprot:1150373-Pelagomonas_calceolata.AAC.12
MELLANSASREVLRLELMREESAARARAGTSFRKQADLMYELQSKVGDLKAQPRWSGVCDWLKGFLGRPSSVQAAVKGFAWATSCLSFDL